MVSVRQYSGGSLDKKQWLKTISIEVHMNDKSFSAGVYLSTFNLIKVKRRQNFASLR